MKKIVRILFIGILFMLSFGCEDYLTKEPLDSFSDDNFWTKETNVRTYAQEFYLSFFAGYGTDFTVFGGFFTGDSYNDDIASSSPKQFPRTTDEAYTSSTWDFTLIRKANVMLERVAKMDLDNQTKAHWLGVGRFFRALRYSELVRRFGDVPWYGRVPRPDDEDYLYKERDPQVNVVDSMMNDMTFAVNNIRADDGTLQINKYVAAAYMSRCMLYHATWLKYHGATVSVPDVSVPQAKIKSFMEAAKWAAKTVIESGNYAIGNTYNELFSSATLAGNKEILFYREFEAGMITNALMSYNAIEEQAGGITKNCMDSYLCDDGLPIAQSIRYQGDNDPTVKGVFANRDPRLYQCFVDSLRLAGLHIGTSPTGYPCKKFLNEEWLAQGLEYTTNNRSIADCPLIRYAEVLLNYAEAAYELSLVGGEAFTQNDLDMSVNQLRHRNLTRYGTSITATMPDLKISGGNPAVMVSGVLTVINDPARDTDVSPMLWEIRRERRIELLMEGRRNEDLNRWRKFDKLNTGTDSKPNDINMGAWIVKSKYPANLFTGTKPKVKLYYPTGSQDAGYMWPAYAGNLQRSFTGGSLTSERVYLNSIPKAQITLYQSKEYELAQNPGWE
jgi:hypothetical protein